MEEEYMKRNLFWGAAVLATTLVSASPAVAQLASQRTYLTFSGDVELPGKTLPAGTYTFEIFDSPSDRHIVQVFDRDRQQLITTLMTVPAQRLEVSDETVVTFEERAEDAPPAVHFWYYPGRQIGHEFIYPREQAMRIARSSNMPVLAADATDTESMKTAKVTRIDPQGSESEYTSTMTSRSESEATAAGRVQSGQSATTQTGQGMTSTTQSGQSAAAAAQTRDAERGQAISRDRMAMNQSQATTADPAQERPARLPQTAGADPMLLLLAVSSFLGLAAVGEIRRRF
jgi:hypothetical protein